MSKVAIGIDLGTTYSGAAILSEGVLRMIPDNSNNVIMPSLVAFQKDNILVGEDVRYQMARNAENSIFDVKRFMGKSFDDKSIKSNIKLSRWPFTIVQENQNVKLEVNFKGDKKRFLPEEISALILKRLKFNCESHLGRQITDAVISVPAYFNDNQRNATRNAGKLAGFNVLRILNEPTAAALTFGYEQTATDKDTEKHILVYDLGGGTFDVSILNIRDRHFQVLATSGDCNLGGEDFTNRIRTYLTEELRKSRNIDISRNKLAFIRLKEACEKAKRRLSSRNCRKADIEIDSLYRNIDQISMDYSATITRTQFEELNNDLFNYTLDLVQKCLDEANINLSQIDDVVLVGGSTRIPKIQELIGNYFGSHKLNKNINPDEVVALGAAIEAAILTDNGGSPQIQNTILLDVTPLSLGISVINDEMSVVVKKNTLIPIKEIKRYVTSGDNQTKLRFRVYQGERANVNDNFFLGKFTLSNLIKAPKYETKVDVMFDLNMDGILTVTAKEVKADGGGDNYKSIEITNTSGRLTEGEIKQMMDNAKFYQEEDKKFRRKSAVKNELDHFIHDVHCYLSLKTTKEKLTASQYKDCKAQYETALEYLSSQDDAEAGDFEDNMEDLRELCDPIIGEMFHKEKGRKIGELSLNRSTCSFLKQTSKYDLD